MPLRRDRLDRGPGSQLSGRVSVLGMQPVFLDVVGAVGSEGVGVRSGGVTAAVDAALIRFDDRELRILGVVDAAIAGRVSGPAGARFLAAALASVRS